MASNVLSSNFLIKHIFIKLTSSFVKALRRLSLFELTSKVQWWYAFGCPNFAAVPDIYERNKLQIKINSNSQL